MAGLAEVETTDNRFDPAELVRGGMALGDANSLDWPVDVADDDDEGLGVDIMSKTFSV